MKDSLETWLAVQNEEDESDWAILEDDEDGPKCKGRCLDSSIANDELIGWLYIKRRVNIIVCKRCAFEEMLDTDYLEPIFYDDFAGAEKCEFCGKVL